MSARIFIVLFCMYYVRSSEFLCVKCQVQNVSFHLSFRRHVDVVGLFNSTCLHMAYCGVVINEFNTLCFINVFVATVVACTAPKTNLNNPEFPSANNVVIRRTICCFCTSQCTHSSDFVRWIFNFVTDIIIFVFCAVAKRLVVYIYILSS